MSDSADCKHEWSPILSGVICLACGAIRPVRLSSEPLLVKCTERMLPTVVLDVDVSVSDTDIVVVKRP